MALSHDIRAKNSYRYEFRSICADGRKKQKKICLQFKWESSVVSQD